MKKFVRIFALLLIVAMLAGCGASTKEYSCKGLTMTVPSYMVDASNNSDFGGFTFALDSSKIAIVGLQESYADYPVLAEYSLKDYTDLTIQANGLDCLAKERTSRDYRYFDYTATTEYGNYRYLVGCFQTDDGFWMVQIWSQVTDFELEEFLGYMDSVRFS